VIHWSSCKSRFSLRICSTYRLWLCLLCKTFTNYKSLRSSSWVYSFEVDPTLEAPPTCSRPVELRKPYCGAFCKSGRSSGTIAPSTGQTWIQMPQSIQVAKSIQYQSVPLLFLPGPSWIQATGQASTQSATPSQVLVTIVCGTVFFLLRKDGAILAESLDCL